MKLSLFFLAFTGANAFAPAFAPRQSTALSASMAEVRKTIDGLSSDNFTSALSEIEGFLKEEAGATFYAKSMRRIATKAKAVGATVPEGYALDAKATAKRREKQDAFIKMKQEEAASASEEEAPKEE